ncbi:Mfa1 family fimbria major subunit [Bacteroides sp. 519]|uniref:Mfa1 family fimbria major subunit n=1 Tax=Bacteroides sp. 519 TaxID=2302937 RepID=UPI0013D37511|nr:Mfa1 family fimbria major subunit [Bacteroides sp. 519]NDV56945.1 hypothetical protein [Bacteroides sp. 519]
MKIHYYTIFLIFITGSLVSCINESITCDIDPGGNNESKGMLSLKIRIPLTKSKIPARDYTEINKDSYNEILINEVRVVFYKETEKNTIVEHLWNPDINLSIDNTTEEIAVTGNDLHSWKTEGESILIQTIAHPLHIEHYYMLIAVNPNNAIKAITALEQSVDKLDIPFDTFDDSGRNFANMYTGTGSTHFLMLNRQGLIKLTNTNFHKTKEEAEETPVEVNVERTVAKVTVGYDISEFYGRFVMWANEISYLTATDIKWHLNVVNKKSYWLRHLTNKAGALGMEKQGDTDWENFYAEDPNFAVANTTYADFRYLTPDDFTYTNGTNYSPRKLSPPSYPSLSGIDLASYWSWAEGDGPMYIPENTMEEDAQTGDKTTTVVFEITLRRDWNSSDANTTGTPPTVEPFFVFKGGTQESAEHIHNNAYYENDERKYFYIISPQDMALYASGTVTDNQINPYIKEGLFDKIEKFKKENPNFNFSNWKNETAAKTNNLIFYNSAKLYYEVPIEHFSVAQAGGKGKYGRFGVVRNNLYNLNINKIMSLGSLTIPTPGTDLIETQ